MDNYVLVVEDDAALNKLMCELVKMAGYSVRSALDGRSGLLLAGECPPALVLLDLMLPDISGFEVCKELKRDPRTSSTAVVLVTALSDEKSRRRGQESCADAYLVKPVSPDRLIETVQKYAACTDRQEASTLQV